MVAQLIAAGARAVAGGAAKKGAKKSARGVQNVAVRKTAANDNRPPKPRLVSDTTKNLPTHAQSRADKVGEAEYRSVRNTQTKPSGDNLDPDYVAERAQYSGVQNARQIRKQKAQAADTNETTSFKRRLQTQRKKIERVKKLTKKVGLKFGDVSASQKIKLLRALSMIWYVCLILLIVQVGGALISISGLVLEGVASEISLSGLASLFSDTVAEGIEVTEDNFAKITGISPDLARAVPGMTMFQIGYLIAAAAGLATLAVTVATFLFNGVRWFDTEYKIASFVFAFAMYLSPIPLLNLLPWGLVWVWAVFSNSKKPLPRWI